MHVELRIRRFNPEADEQPHWETYGLEVEPTDPVLQLLHQVKWYQDGTLTFRRSCAHGVCGSDAMVINGRNRLACETLVGDLGPKISVEALKAVPLVKDLLVDMDGFMDKYRQVMPFLVNDEIPEDGKERRQSPAERERYDDTTKCILCAACTTACPSSGPTPPTSAQRRSSMRIASSWTAATRHTRSASRSWPTPTACGVAGRCSTASRPARAAST